MANVDHLIQAVQQGDVRALEELVVFYFNRMEYEEAREWALEGVQVDNDVCLHYLGVIAENTGRFDEAIRWYAKNVNVNEDSMSATNLGCIYLNMNDDPNMPTDREKAEYYLDYAYRRDGSNGMAALGLALCKLANDNIDANEFEHLLNVAYNNTSGELKTTAKRLLDDFHQSAPKPSPPPQQSKGGDCFITTAVCLADGKPDDCYELTAFRKFRDGWLVKQSDGQTLIDEYYSIAPRIVERIERLTNAAEIYKSVWKEYLSGCLSLIESGDYEGCRQKYVAMVKDLRKRFLKEGL